MPPQSDGTRISFLFLRFVGGVAALHTTEGCCRSGKRRKQSIRGTHSQAASLGTTQVLMAGAMLPFVLRKIVAPSRGGLQSCEGELSPGQLRDVACEHAGPLARRQP